MRKVEDYDRYHRHIQAWAKRDIDNLVVKGEPGFGKSWAAKTVLEGQPHHWFSARQSPLFVYRELCDQPDWPIVFDDVASLLRSADFVDMFKNLCEDGVATLRWGTTTAKLEGRPNTFRCSSPVLVLLNGIPEKNSDVRAILDRCDNIEFAPTKAQVIAYMRAYFPEDAEIIDLLAELPVLASMRALTKARRWKKADDLNLHEELLSEFGAPDGVVTLINIMEKHPKKEWCRRFVETTTLGERTYRRHKAIAEDLLAARKSPDACPIDRLKPVFPATDGREENGHSDTGFSFRLPA
ncbi:MAG: hypothetical protein PVI86_20130 [Phycisphaerae bacterium]|jgi:hypothetical protein